MTDPDELIAILDCILNGCRDEGDIAILRQSLKASSGKNIVKLGKYKVNIGEGKDIHIGDKVYQGADAETIRSIFLEVLSQNTRQLEIDWHDISQTMLSEQQRLTTNPLTSGEGITYRTEQVYVPLGLVERKKQPRRREDVSPEQGSELYRETEITRTFEHEQFLEQVLRHRQSPKNQGKRIAIIGEPGAGKTTLLQQIAQWVSREMAQSVVIWVSLADLRSRGLESYLLEIWLQAVARKVGQAEPSTQVQDDFVAQFNKGLVWLVLDGVDEMQATVGNPLGEIERQIRTGTLLQQARIVLSCRLNLWDGGSNALNSFDNYRTLEFSYPQQVEQFIGNWFSSLPSAETQTGQRLCTALRESGKERIRDLGKNPLRLTLLCFNWYLVEGKLPETKAGLYEQFVADFYKWKKGQFATTGEQRKRLNAALGELAREAIDKEATRFRLRQEFVCEYLGEPDDADSLFGLALRLGWLNKVGVEAENPKKGVYAFFHPTFEEYFAALGIDDWHYFLNHIPKNPSHSKASYRIFEEKWKEVFLLWLGCPSKKLVEHKILLIEGLVNFRDDCGDFSALPTVLKGFYEYQAYFLASLAISEFKDFAQSKLVIEQIIYWSFGDFLKEEQEITTLLEPIAETGSSKLMETDSEIAIEILLKLAKKIQSKIYSSWHSIPQLSSQPYSNRPRWISSWLTSYWRIAQKLGAFSNDLAVQRLIELIGLSPHEDFLYQLIEGLGQITHYNLVAVDTLSNLATSTRSEKIRSIAAYSLGKADKNSELAVKLLFELICSNINSSYRHIHLSRLRVIAQKGNIFVLPSIKKFLKESQNEDICQELKLIVQQLHERESEKIQNLDYRDIQINNPNEIDIQIKVIQNSQNSIFLSKEDTLKEAIWQLRLNGKGNSDALDILIEIVRNPEYRIVRCRAADSLIEIMEDSFMPRAVATLKNCLTLRTYEEDIGLFQIAYKVIWHCSSKLEYKIFNSAWQ